MKVLVTGATGFIGTYVIENLLNAGHEVIATSTDIRKAQCMKWFNRVYYKLFTIGMEPSSEDLFSYFEKPDLLIHLAWSRLPNYKDSFHIDKNLWPHFNFIQNMVSHGLKDLLVTGTCLEYGLQGGALKEDMITSPGNPYATAKDSLRNLLEAFQSQVFFNFKWVRLFYMYGKGQNPKALIPMLELAVANGDTVFKMSGGEQLRDYLHVNEVADILVKIGLQNNVQGIINCCSGKPVSVRSLVEQYLQKNNINIELQMGHYPYPDYEPMEFWGNQEKLQTIINFCNVRR